MNNYVLKTNGQMFPISKKPTLEEMQKIVGGYIEVVPLWDGKFMVLNEEGKLKNLDFNFAATLYANLPGDYIVGDVLICQKEWLE